MITRAQPYYNYKTFLQNHYGCELYSIPIDLGYGCPNRDENRKGGCTFCPESGARAQQTINAETVEEQVSDAVDFAKRRYGARKFAAYIQAFTGTFAAASEQRRVYTHLLEQIPFEALHIGTRPDCLSKETIEFLTEMQEQLDIRIELGVQTANNRTLSRINRGHTWEQSKEAIQLLDSKSIPVIAHVIIGLPGETIDDCLSTATELAKLPLSGIKIHNLHIIKNTDLAAEYSANPFHLLNEHEYLDALIEFIRRTNQDIPIIRIQTDTPPDELVAPKWSISKGQLIDTLVQHMNWRLAYQGELTSHPPASPYRQEKPEEIVTDDNSITLWNPRFKEHYHTSVGARSEAVHKYIAPSMLAETLQKHDIRLLDVCFGLGYNSLEACCTARSLSNAGQLSITALEIDHAVLNDAASISEDINAQCIIAGLIQNGSYSEKNICIELIWGDARHTADILKDEQFDIIFLDAFSTQRNSELWTVEFFLKLRTLIAPEGRLLTYCSSLPVIAGLLNAGFHVGRTEDAGRMRGGTIASLSPDIITEPLSSATLEQIKNSTRGIPYHDESNIGSNKDILKAREEQVRRWKEKHPTLR